MTTIIAIATIVMAVALVVCAIVGVIRLCVSKKANQQTAAFMATATKAVSDMMASYTKMMEQVEESL